MLKINSLRFYENESDGFLINAVKSGDSDAFSELIDRYSKVIDYNLSSFAWRLFRSNNLTDNTERDDLFQECCIVLLKAAKHFDFNFDVKFSTYANACIKNYLISLYRKYTKSNGYIVVSLDDRNVARDLNVNTDKNSDEIMYSLCGSTLSSEVFDVQILSRLTKFEQQVCALYLQSGSYREIAEALGKNIKSVDNAVCRIKTKLKRLSAVR